MLKDIANNQFVEYGQFDGHYYGTKLDTIRQCIRSGTMCVLDISPQVSASDISVLIETVDVINVFLSRSRFSASLFKKTLSIAKYECAKQSSEKQSQRKPQQCFFLLILTSLRDMNNVRR